MRRLWTALAELVLLPAGIAAVESLPEVRPGDDVLPWIARVWTESRAISHGTANKPAARFVDTLLQSCELGPKLTWGIPGAVSSGASHRLGDRLAWWP